MNNQLESKIKTLCKMKHENEWVEFKENWFEPITLGIYISAISNSAALLDEEFGYFIWGISDNNHSIEGTDFDPNQDYKKEPLKHFLARQITPDIGFKFDELVIDGKNVVCLTIPKAHNIPTAFMKVRYIRIGSSKEDISKYPSKEVELFNVLKNGFPTVDNIESANQSLSFSQLFTYYAGKGIELRLSTFKKNLHFLTKTGKYNLLAQLLSDNSDISIRVSLFSGTDKTAPLFSVREFGKCCILVSLDKIIEYGDVLNLVQADERNRIVERQDITLFQSKPFREAIINAFVHNKWTSKNGPIISVFSNRIEIISRGELSGGQTEEGFFAGESMPVNQRLADIFMQLHISEQSGRGVPKIVAAYGKKAFDFRENSIAVTIPFNWINKTGDNVGDKVGDKTVIQVNKTQALIIEEMRDNPNITLLELQKTLSLGRTAIQNNVSSLRKRQIIKRVGSNKNGYWEVTDKLNNR